MRGIACVLAGLLGAFVVLATAFLVWPSERIESLEARVAELEAVTTPTTTLSGETIERLEARVAKLEAAATPTLTPLAKPTQLPAPSPTSGPECPNGGDLRWEFIAGERNRGVGWENIHLRLDRYGALYSTVEYVCEKYREITGQVTDETFGEQYTTDLEFRHEVWCRILPYLSEREQYELIKTLGAFSSSRLSEYWIFAGNAECMQGT